jgi:hypothetical protein
MGCMWLKPFLLHFHDYPHHNRSIHVRVTVPFKDGRLSAGTAGGQYGILGSTAKAGLLTHWMNRQVGRHSGTGLWCVFKAASDAVFIDEAQRNPFRRPRGLRLLPTFVCRKVDLLSDSERLVSEHNMIQ